MGNKNSTSKNYTSSSKEISDDELLCELEKQINNKLSKDMGEIKITGIVISEYIRRNTSDDGLIKMEKLREILDKHNKPYIISFSSSYSILVQFVHFPSNIKNTPESEAK